jgi:hypothetical protein
LMLGSMIVTADFIVQFVVGVAKPVIAKVGEWVSSFWSWIKTKAQGAWSWITGLFSKKDETLTAAQQAELNAKIDELVIMAVKESGESCDDPIILGKLRAAMVNVVGMADESAAKIALLEAMFAFKNDMVGYKAAMAKAAQAEVNLDQPGINPIRGRKPGRKAA